MWSKSCLVNHLNYKLILCIQSNLTIFHATKICFPMVQGLQWFLYTYNMKIHEQILFIKSLTDSVLQTRSQ